MISEEAIQQLIGIHFKEMGVLLSTTEAIELGKRLITLTKIVLNNNLD